MTKRKIREWYEHWRGDVYVSYSGGQDSDVLLHMTREIYPQIEGVFFDTGLEWPENREHVKSQENITFVRPKKTPKEIIENYGYPVISKEQSQYIYEYRNTNSEKLRRIRWEGNDSGWGKIAEKWKFLVDAPFKISDKCCYHMKKSPARSFENRTNKKAILGERADESNLRTSKYLRFGCNSFETKRPISRPMSFWTKQDVLDYIDRYNLEYSDIYDLGWSQTGCIYCGFGVHMEEEPNRFQRLKKVRPKLWTYAMETLGYREVLEYIGIPGGDKH